MNHLSKASTAIVLLASSLIAACGGSTHGAGQGVESTSQRVVASVDTTIQGPDGVTLRIPAGSLDADTTVTITTSPATRHSGSMLKGLMPQDLTIVSPVVVTVAPIGRRLGHAVEITIPIDPSLIPSSAGTPAIEPVGVNNTFVPLPTRRTSAAAIAVLTDAFSSFTAVVPGGDGGVVTGCGDRTCSAGEDCSTCSSDCGLCLPANECGNHLCEAAEDCTSCAFDCACSSSMDGGATPDAGAPTTVTIASQGLEWQRDVSPLTYTWAAADAYCTALVLNGQSDWRLPIRFELASIVDYSKSNPAIDPALFPGTTPTTFWTSSTSYAVSPGTRVVVYFANGMVGGAFETDSANVRCVRDVVSHTATLMDNGNGTVTDTRTNLVWQQDPMSAAGTYSVAATYCGNLTLAGGGWRLPTAPELFSIVDQTRWMPTIDTVVFPNTASAPYFSSTVDIGTAGFYWGVDFAVGTGSELLGTGSRMVRCVR